ncbi:hypothetical protein [Pseudonocardia broussonetiae]|uniref:Uncharacterized protein n=1 Tax=Pseudonocardia broussonetiae TaxID=2736640 RepID=A0A6M6JJR2_9PSEU|nr:hypothetical protein [Pseudonocardia broussonetiae]QJY46669.1 hypothetical protein HOP40_13270 [Pseudonocardia broussonetiae]
MTTRDRAALACILASLTTLALYTAAALQSGIGYAVAFFLGGSAIALTFPDPKDTPRDHHRDQAPPDQPQPPRSDVDGTVRPVPGPVQVPTQRTAGAHRGGRAGAARRLRRPR